MRYLLPGLALLVSACSQQSKVAPVVQAVSKPVEKPSDTTRTLKAPGPLTKDEEALATLKGSAYIRAMLRSIAELDDLSSPPESVARAAIAENIDRLKDWKRADTANYFRMPGFKSFGESLLAALPSQPQIDNATYMVLKSRKQRQQHSESDAAERYLDYLKQLRENDNGEKEDRGDPEFMY